MDERDEESRPRLDVDPRGTDAAAVEPPADELFDALADRKRRLLLWVLVEEGSATVEELADVLLGGELPGTGVAGPADRDRVRAMLHHVHLPKLDDVGLVERDDDEVRLAPVSDPVQDLVRFARRYGRAANASTSG